MTMNPRTTGACQKVVLEVERKFRCDVGSFARINQNKGVPRFRQLHYIGSSTFTDNYYDKNDLLTSKGIWIRQRDDTWQAKIRQGGNFTNSQFEEVTGRDDVFDLVRRHIGRAAVQNANALGIGLPLMAAIGTQRHTWTADGTFMIVVDTTDFGHVVGEVELERQVVGSSDGTDNSYLRNKMDREIEAFMQRYPWAFPPGKVFGKLSAFFRLQKSDKS